MALHVSTPEPVFVIGHGLPSPYIFCKDCVVSFTSCGPQFSVSEWELLLESYSNDWKSLCLFPARVERALYSDPLKKGTRFGQRIQQHLAPMMETQWYVCQLFCIILGNKQRGNSNRLNWQRFSFPPSPTPNKEMPWCYVLLYQTCFVGFFRHRPSKICVNKGLTAMRISFCLEAGPFCCTHV